MIILKTKYLDIRYVLPVLLALAALAGGPKIQAQAALQPSSSNLQPQTGQAQAPGTNNLNQTGAVQTGNGNQSFLNQSGLRPLGVVSDPRQAAPALTASPSTELRADTKNEARSRNLTPYIAVFSAAIFVAGFVYLWRAERKPEEPQEEIIIRPEPVRVKKAKATTRKKKKPKRR